jgi:hypothetical protein
MNRFTWKAMAACGALLAAMVGCNAAGTGTMRGEVTYQGQPLPTGTVTIVSTDGSASASGQIQNGAYEVQGAPVGPVRIAVSTPPPAAAPPPGVPAAGGETQSISIPGKYAYPDQSGLTYTVTSGVQTHNITLE